MPILDLTSADIQKYLLFTLCYTSVAGLAFSLLRLAFFLVASIVLFCPLCVASLALAALWWSGLENLGYAAFLAGLILQLLRAELLRLLRRDALSFARRSGLPVGWLHAPPGAAPPREAATGKSQEPRKPQRPRRPPSFGLPALAQDPTRHLGAAIRYFGLDAQAFTEEELRQAHIRKALEAHPDRRQALDAPQRRSSDEEMKILNAARDLIRKAKGWR